VKERENLAIDLYIPLEQIIEEDTWEHAPVPLEKKGDDRMKFGMIALMIVLVAGAFLGGCKCNCDEKECVCTEIFFSYQVTVTDAAGLPVSTAEVAVWFEATGNTVDCSEIHNRDKGQYCIMSDTYRKQLDEDGETVIARFSAPGYKTLTEEYLFTTDDCQCHIRHIYGPSSVTMTKI